METIISEIVNCDFIKANKVLEEFCGIVDFFSSEEEKLYFITDKLHSTKVAEDRISYGDWQTPYSLALEVCKEYKRKFGNPDIVIEPTCGKGSFVIAALTTFTNLSKIIAIEINKDYVFELKKIVLNYAINNHLNHKPKIIIYNADFFKFNLNILNNQISQNNVSSIALIGNPPWVTSTALSGKQSDNIPIKANILKLKGIEAITGKGNFDISESVCIKLFEFMQGKNGGIGMLLKNAVIRNLLYKQKSFSFNISNIQQEKINAQKEFGVAVDASCLFAKLGSNNNLQCKVSDFYNKQELNSYGWVNDKFVSNIQGYNSTKQIEGKSAYQWRSGIKHDCASVMELKLVNGKFKNRLKETIEIEEDLIYPLLKSSDIFRDQEQNKERRFVIIPQRYVGEDTGYIEKIYPKTFSYLSSHKELFDNRKSSIYKGKPPFSIFGVGQYSFMPYKIVISSLYKKIKFKKVEPQNGKAVIIDDTCYQLGFDTLEECNSVLKILESDMVKDFLKSISFEDSKRVITRDLLMRINLQ